MMKGRRLMTMATLSFALAGAVVIAGQRSADVALRAAIETEMVRGDVNGAIEQYIRVVDLYGRSDRATAAQALLRLAEAYQKLGDAQAKGVYERLVQDYGDQPQAVALARMRLAVVNPTARATRDRVVKAGELITWGDGRVSSDGRLISYTDWMFTGNLMLHDLVTGTDRALTGNKDWSVGNAYTSAFSRDGRQVAYGWRTYRQQSHVNELRIVTTEATRIPQPRRVYGSENIDFFYPSDWSPDGRSLAVRVVRRDRTGQIALIGVQDGSFRPLKTVGWRGPNKIFFSPDGRSLAYDLPASDTESQRDVFIIAVDGSRETRAVGHPADDVVMGWWGDGSRLLFASDRTGAIGLWALPVSDGKPLGAPMLLKPDIGSVLSQGLTASGALHIVKDTSTLSLQVAPIDLDAGKLSGPPVLENFRSGRPDWSSDGKQLAYRFTGANGLPVISIRSVDSGEVRELRPALGYINEPRWLPDARSLVVSGRDFNGRGGIYRIDAQTGRETLITETADINRVQMSPDGRKTYYSIGFFNPEDRPARIVERDLISGETRDVHRKGSSSEGNAELSPDGQSLATIVTDGAAKTSTVMLIPIGGGEPRELLGVSLPDEFEPYGNMSWTPNSRAVIVVKTNGDRKELWRVPVSGGGARKLDIDTTGWVITGSAGIRLHPNGKEIAFFTGQSSREVWTLENIAPSSSTR